MRVAWAKGGEVEIVASDGLHVTVLSTRAVPPGAPIEGFLEDTEVRAFVLKVASARREGDRFVVAGRLFGATTALREAFLRAAPERKRP